MLIVSSNKIPNLDSETSLWFYNGIDCAATLMSWEKMQSQRSENSNLSYSFVSGMRAPALEMSLGGIKVNMEKRAQFIDHFSKKKTQLQENLDQMAIAVWDKPLNTASPAQMKDFFYNAMKLPEQYKIYKGKRTVSADRTALEKLSFHFHAQPLCSTALAIRDVTKKLQFLHTGIDQDYRFRAGFNVVGTETGRWASSENSFGTGTNFQNITPELREIFIADEGMKLAYIDLEQAESRVVAYCSGDTSYIKAFESGDLHTTVAAMCFTNLPWTGDMKHDRLIADEPYYRHFSYRDIAKRLGHATNYNGAARTLAGILKVPEELVTKFQQAYFSAFSGIRKWHHTVASQLQTKGYLITGLGRKRNFLGRRYDDATLREAIAFEPQSTVGELLNLFLYRVWKTQPEARCLGQIHDAILIQYPQERELEILPKIVALADIPVKYPAGIMVIPAEAQSGWNWAKQTETNIHGLKKFKGKSDERIPPIYKGVLDW